MSLPLTNAKKQYQDQNGNPLAGGSVAYYIPSTLTPVNTYQDQALTIPNTNPVVLDANGQAVAWIADATSVREIVKDSLGNQIWDQVTAVGNGQNLAGASGSSFVGFQQAGFGATVRTSQDKARERVSVYDFMTPAQIVGSQTPTSVDHTSAFQEAANACLAAGVDSHLHIPRGTYNLSAPVNIAFSGVVSGSGMQDTVIRLTNATQHGFTNTGGVGQVIFRDLKIDATVTKTAGAGICINTVNPTDSPQTIARFQNVCANNQYCGIQILNAAYWVIDACVITNANTYGIYSDCTQNFDAGDNTITGGTLISGGATGVGIYLINNCRVNNAKILGHDTGILVQPSAAAGTRVDFQLGPALSIENQQNFGIRVSVNAASVGVANSHINGVQTGGIVNNNAVGIQIEGPAAGFNIQNNICVLGATGQRGIVLVNNGIGSASAIIISNNLVTGGDATSVGIIGDGSNGLITDNLLLNLGTPLTIASSGGGVTVRNQTLTFAQLPTTIANGSIVYCSNGTAANPVASGGTGCLAKRLNGVWVGN